MSNVAIQPSDNEFKQFGEYQGQRWDEGESLDCLVVFQHDGKDIVSPYSYTLGDPAELFGTEKMDAWKRECVELWAEWTIDQ